MKKYIFPLALAVFPVFAMARDDIVGKLGIFREIIDALIPIIIGLAVLVFIWGILKYVVAKSDEDQTEARKIIVSGVIILFVMVSIWGLVSLLGETLDLDEGYVPRGPELPRS